MRVLVFALLIVTCGTCPVLAIAQEIAVTFDGSMFRLGVQGEPVFVTSTNPICEERVLQLPGSSTFIVLWNVETQEGEIESYHRVFANGLNNGRSTRTSYKHALGYAEFDPLDGDPAIHPEFLAGPESTIHIVQFFTHPMAEYRRAIEALGGTPLKYLPRNSWIVEMPSSVRLAIDELPYVRAISSYHPAYRLDPAVFDDTAFLNSSGASRRFHVLLFDHDAAAAWEAVVSAIEMSGGVVDVAPNNGHSIVATLTGAQLLALLGNDAVMHVSPWAEPSLLVDTARIVGGLDYVEAVTGFSGDGVRGAVADTYLDLAHPDFQAIEPQLLGPNGIPENPRHGTAVYGTIFGDGTGDPRARGMLPAGHGVFMNGGWFYSLQDTFYCLLVSELDPLACRLDCGATLPAFEGVECPYQTTFLNLSYVHGGASGQGYTNYHDFTNDIDRRARKYDLLTVVGQGNNGTQVSSAEAWGKNVVSVGGIYHQNTACDDDDVWSLGTGIPAASIGPAADGRVKPDLSFFFDQVYVVSDNPGPYGEFGGTSVATPLVSGCFGVLFQMWNQADVNGVDNIFGVPLREPGGGSFANRPRMSTAKAMMINRARPYEFVAGINRFNAGWGRPDMEAIYELRDHFPLIVDESDVLAENQHITRSVEVAQGAADLRITMVYTDPPALADAAVHAVNELRLWVRSPSGLEYWGNAGLIEGQWSQVAAAPEVIDTVQNVFVPFPESGIWHVSVTAWVITEDAYEDTVAEDAAYSLVVSTGRADCNGNGLVDSEEVADGLIGDWNSDGKIDECQAIYVDAAANGTGDGSSWTNAFTDLALVGRELLNPCAGHKSQVWVAEGTYLPAEPNGDRRATFGVPSGVTLLGGFPSGGGRFDQRNPWGHPTILSGDLNGDDASGQKSDNSLHVVTYNPDILESNVPPEAVLDGFVVAGGNANGTTFDEKNGGGVFGADAGLFKIVNCTIRDNRALAQGGGVFSAADLMVANSKIVGNYSGAFGGGVACAFRAKAFTNTVIAGNESGGLGGGLYSSGTMALHNCTVHGNAAVVAGGVYQQDGVCIADNSIVWENEDDSGYSSAAQITVLAGEFAASHCDIQGGWAGDGNINAVPRFVDSNHLSFHLLAMSPCIDSGSRNLLPQDDCDLDQDGNRLESLPIDIEGNPRDFRCDVDMGAFESRACPAGGILAERQPPYGPEYNTIDARQPHSPEDNRVSARQGIGSGNRYPGGPEPIVIELSRCGASDVDCWEICETGIEQLDSGCPAEPLDDNKIAGIVESIPGVYEITLDRPISAGHWTTVTYLGDGSHVSYASLPGDANADGRATAVDVLRLIDYLNGVAPPPWGLYSMDINHNGIGDKFDPKRLIELLKGAQCFVQWDGRTLPGADCKFGGRPVGGDGDTKELLSSKFVEFLQAAETPSGEEEEEKLDAYIAAVTARIVDNYEPTEKADLANALESTELLFESDVVADEKIPEIVDVLVP